MNYLVNVSISHMYKYNLYVPTVVGGTHLYSMQSSYKANLITLGRDKFSFNSMRQRQCKVKRYKERREEKRQRGGGRDKQRNGEREGVRKRDRDRNKELSSTLSSMQFDKMKLLDEVCRTERFKGQKLQLIRLIVVQRSSK